jgi:D-alanyl-D-alanine carboxypeptidase (penicillin-binding protein 5/6)
MEEEEFTFNGIHQQNRNGLLHAGIGIDAGKTGHTEDTGYHLASSAVQNGERLVVVVMGTGSFGEREGTSLEQYRTFFATYSSHTVFKPGDAVVANAPVWQGSQPTVNLTVAEPFKVYISRADQDKLKAEVHYNSPLVAPLESGKPVGEITLTLPNGQKLVRPLVPQQAVERAGFAKRFMQTLGSKF